MEEERIRNHTREFSTHSIMNTTEVFPVFDDCFSNLNQFILELVQAYEMGKINSWDDLEEKAHTYFTLERIEHMESVVPGWQKMASYSGGITVVHVMCVFLGLFMLPEFQNLTSQQQQLAKWIVLFHDVEKAHIRGKKDTTHAFRSAASTARRLPHLGFAVRKEYDHLIASWSEFTSSAIKTSADFPEPVQDNDNLPEILSGLERMFGKDTPATLIVKSVLFHMSINVVSDWPQAAPLTGEEIKRYITNNLEPLLKVMMLADNEGWGLFSSERQQQRTETQKVFQGIEETISR
jgi:hypothetical protein